MKQSDTKQDLLDNLKQVRNIVVNLKKKNHFLNEIVNADDKLQVSLTEIQRLHTKITSMESELYYSRNLRDSQNRLHYSHMNEYKRSATNGDSMYEAGMDYLSDRDNDSGTNSGIYDTFRRGVKYVHDSAGFLLNSDSPAKSRNDSSSPVVPGAFKLNLSDATDSRVDIIGMTYTELKDYYSHKNPSLSIPGSMREVFSSVLNLFSEEDKKYYTSKYNIVGNFNLNLTKIHANCSLLYTMGMTNYDAIRVALEKETKGKIILPPLIQVPNTNQHLRPSIEDIREALSKILPSQRNRIMDMILVEKATNPDELKKKLSLYGIRYADMNGPVKNHYYLFHEDET